MKKSKASTHSLSPFCNNNNNNNKNVNCDQKFLTKHPFLIKKNTRFFQEDVRHVAYEVAIVLLLTEELNLVHFVFNDLDTHIVTRTIIEIAVVMLYLIFHLFVELKKGGGDCKTIVHRLVDTESVEVNVR